MAHCALDISLQRVYYMKGVSERVGDVAKLEEMSHKYGCMAYIITVTISP